ncbi:arabinose-5-phosphate isomerase [Candidatus Kryptonium thompsonii]|uniref:Arabinose-5-phosphate isomerase n=1 Tax=Candidatus Kryptonium thompsonii TaxID=1633631 RepID=A0A0N7MT24_9BACT|nr:KpsF/GutQ family sugar-phosphate isomerase [Candidatus Kryptonium thompsoni]CUS78050.1 arabinose-5-phosphate isomerase [Candidatus Kryptonium thompsoni]CUS79246.1 arabinose-5-phosphate isomerase [Candidatus Kryptonium thompsoni]CUS80857.1 arabinose-5-phosphate isomerase [Candidatus Kryptonium thompsoni]CUS84205.1 arabinose-5-phosphate isomerase [Candidatus Kryptonium thompsoni]CUS86200.1 arabinose-5-phosphate isomerase [Candidatus Kryptonium thompsoni]
MEKEQVVAEKNVIEIGKRVIRIESSAVAELEKRIDENFAKVVDLILNSSGRVIITGVGKSGIIARKIVATLNSTGTPALYLHPVDALHGDLGVVRKEDVVICISKSGNTIEVLQLIPIFKRIGVPIISMVGNMNSQLARLSDYILNVSVKEEACPYNLAPTASTTATLAMGDALAIALLEKRNFTKENFALFHPGGILGKRLLLKVEELMVSGKEVPIVNTTTPMKETIIEMTSKRLGATCVIDEDGKLVGIITDGDLRRLLQRTENVFALTAGEVMTKNPKVIKKDALAVTALQQMETYNITQLVVIDDDKKPIGMIHIHDLVKAGLSSSETDNETRNDD